MNADNAASNFDIGHGRILPDHLSAEDRGVEGDGAGGISCPDDVFESFDVHGREMTDVRLSGNEEMAIPLAIQ
jgi:hypothetical protein